MSETVTPRQPERVNKLLSVLADGERRAIITHLRDDSTGTTSLDTLATVLADSPTDRDHARIRLHHIHLPKLDDTPILSYDPETTTIEYHGHAKAESLLDTVQRDEPAYSDAGH